MSTMPLPTSPGAVPPTLKLAILASLVVHGLALLGQGPAPAARPLPKLLLTSLRPATPAAPASAPPPVAHAPAPRQPAAPRARHPPVLAAAPSTPPRTTKATLPVASPATNDAPVAPSAAAVPTPSPAQAAPVTVAAAVHAALSAASSDEAPDPALLERYGRSLSSLLAQQQNYPRMAMQRGWEGDVQLRVTIARKGNIVATEVLRSSGFEVLDQNAVQLVTNAAPLPRPPDALQNREIHIVVPVHYRLERSS